MVVTFNEYSCASREGTAVGGTKLCTEFRRNIDVDESGNAIATEEPAAPMRAPDKAGRDRRTFVDLLTRPDLDLGLNHCAAVNHRLVAYNDAFEDDCPAFDVALPAHDCAAQLNALADVGVAPDDR